MKRPNARQLSLTLPTWGGKRAGAGRKPKGAKAMLPHDPRPKLAARHPLHVTLKVRPGSVQGDHVHMFVEARDNAALARGVQGFSIRVAKGLNKLLGRKGPVFVDRFHARILRTPREVRNALAYVLLNARHHGLALRKGEADPCSSGVSFDGWRVPPRSVPGDLGPPCTAPPATWLRRVGWRRHGLLKLDETPGHHA